jgi:hypothetical protein
MQNTNQDQPIFPPPLHKYSLQNNSIPTAIIKLNRNLNRRGLLSSGAMEDEKETYEWVIQFAYQIKYGLPLRINVQRRLGRILIWIFQNRLKIPLFYEEVLSQFYEQVQQGKQQISLPNLWFLFCEQFDEPKFTKFFGKVFNQAPLAKRKRLLSKLPDGVALSNQISTDLANAVIEQGKAIQDVDEFLGIDETRLRRDVWKKLLSMKAAPWICAHPFLEITSYLEEIKEYHSDKVALVCRQILETWFNKGYKASDLRKGTSGFSMVSQLRRLLPSSEHTREWRLLGDKAKEILHRWKIAHEIDALFNKWDADDKLRKEFWSSYIDNIDDIQAFRTAEALAMKIGRYWFIEFGKTGNACYCYSQSQWELNRFRTKNNARMIKSPGDLKRRNKGVDFDSKKDHSPSNAWQSKYSQWIYGITKVSRRW